MKSKHCIHKFKYILCEFLIRLRFMRAACQLCDESFNSEIRRFFPENFTDNSILSTIAEMAPTLNDTFINCEYRKRFPKCSKLLFRVYTEAGLCYTYNSLRLNDILTDEYVGHSTRFRLVFKIFTIFLFRVAPELKNSFMVQNSSKWSLERGYDDRNGTETYPLRGFHSRNLRGTLIYTQILNRDIDYLCSSSFDGYLIALHLPNEMPSIRTNVFYLSAKQSGRFWVTPNLIATSPELHEYDPHLRQCYFDSEHKLRFYRQYTQNNCKSECLVNFTHSQCGCVHFAMPSKKLETVAHSHPRQRTRFEDLD